MPGDVIERHLDDDLSAERETTRVLAAPPAARAARRGAREARRLDDRPSSSAARVRSAALIDPTKPT